MAKQKIVRAKVLAVVQARMGSTRLPGKVMKPLAGRTLIEVLISRLRKAKTLDEVLVATTTEKTDDVLAAHCKSKKIPVFRGSSEDVLKRYVDACRKYSASVVVRITGDCPLVDPQLVDSLIRSFANQKVDYLSNTNPPSYPDGLDIEVFTVEALKKAADRASPGYQREHVTPYIYQSGNFKTGNFANQDDFSKERWTVDQSNDLKVVDDIFQHFSPRIDFSWKEVMELRKKNPKIFLWNRRLVRNEGAKLCTGQKLWKRAKQVIPGGNMLLSKRPEMFLPNQWPAYFSKAKGCKVWDLDGKEYIDMSIMGIGTNTLGYGHPEVDEAVRQVISKGNMSTLNCPEEVYLAEKLIELHPWADMARFARSGGEANAIAIRIARAATGKDKVAICGYHGWHDWYLSANLGDDKSLDGHLLPGLEPEGVPGNLRGTVFPFTYNNFSQLEALVKTHDIGIIKMEVMRNQGPQDNFLQKVRKLATERGIVLIFDECTSGFRETYGGLHLKYGVNPDMAMFGKALGNGYAITAVIGKRVVMEAAQKSFISSTFWTERIGPTAALKTLEVMKREKSWEFISETGLKIRKGWRQLGNKHHLRIVDWGIPALTGFTIESPKALAYQTLITQEMLGKGYLARNGIYVCTDHTAEKIESYFNALDPVFELISECENGRDVESLLKGPIAHSGFSRLN
jgi:glutamate-1-semialdehyde 2,1-aminomutase